MLSMGCRRVCVCVCVCVCVQYFERSNMKITIETNRRNRLKDRRHRHPFTVLYCIPVQGRDSAVSGLYESTVKWLSTRVGKTCTHALMQTYRHRNTRRHIYKQINPPTCTDSFAFESFDPVRYARYKYVTEFLQWCVRK